MTHYSSKPPNRNQSTKSIRTSPLPEVPEGYSVVYSTWGDRTVGLHGERHYVFPDEDHSRCYRKLDERTVPSEPTPIIEMKQCSFCVRGLKSLYHGEKLTGAMIEQLRRAAKYSPIQSYHGRGGTLEALERRGLLRHVRTRLFEITDLGREVLNKISPDE